jgi:solute:Na+ symporter, SSS family
MFPQLFQKLIAARDQRALKTTVVLYPLITTALFFLTVSIGVMGRHAFPSLTPAQSESVYPMLLARYASPALATLLLTGGLAALMSTMDSQLLTLGSLVTVDFFPRPARSVTVQRLAVVAVGALGMLLALWPPQSILDFMNRSSFTGLAVLAPTVIGGLYWRRASWQGAVASIAVGEALVALSYFGVIRLRGIQPVVPAVAAAGVAFVVVSTLLPPTAGSPPIPGNPPRRSLAVAIPFVLLFILANDFWAWGRAPVVLLGIPLWTWYSIVLGVALAAAYAVFLRADPAGSPPGAQPLSGVPLRPWQGSSPGARPR